jgi:hypothetical protein
VKLRFSLVADPEPAEVVKPRKRALHDPALPAESRAILGVAPGDQRLDAAAQELAAVLVVVIAAVGQEPVRALAWPARLALHGLDPVGERQQLGDVVAIAAGQGDRQRYAVGVGQQVVL